MTTILWSGQSSTSWGWMRMPSGSSMWPSERPMLTFLRIERPTSATLRPRAAAASTTCCTRWMLEAKLVTMMRPSARAKTSCRCGPTPALRGREARAVGVGRVPAEQEHTLPAQLGQARDVGRHAVHRGLVELVVAGDHDRAQLGAHGHRARVGDRVGHVHELDRERAEVERVAGKQVLDLDVAQAVLVELGAGHGHGEPPAVDRRPVVELAQDPGQRAEMVLVAVGDDDRLDVGRALAQVAEVGQHEVDPEHVGGREAQADVDDDEPVPRTRARSCSCRSRPGRRAAERAGSRRGPQAAADAPSAGPRLACGLAHRVAAAPRSRPWRSSIASMTASSDGSGST